MEQATHLIVSEEQIVDASSSRKYLALGSVEALTSFKVMVEGPAWTAHPVQFAATCYY